MCHRIYHIANIFVFFYRLEDVVFICAHYLSHFENMKVVQNAVVVRQLLCIIFCHCLIYFTQGASENILPRNTATYDLVLCCE